MREGLVRTVTSDPERIARVEAHRERIEREEPKPIVMPKRPTRLSKWLAKIDRINAMGMNWGWSH